jgi:hypothetical protein
MPAHHPRSNKAQANTRRRPQRARAVEPDLELEIDPTPTPRPVAVDLTPLPAAFAPLPAPSSDERAAPKALRRVGMIAAAAAMFVGSVLALRGAPFAAAAPAAMAAAAAAPQALDRAALAKEALAKEPLTKEPLAKEPLAKEPLVKEVSAKEALAEKPAPVAEGPRADQKLDRRGYSPIPGGVLYAPSSFASADGAYDLYIHFHGNPSVVRESAEYAGLNALVAVVNLGINSMPYLNGLSPKGNYIRLLDRIDRSIATRGLLHPQRRRVAIGSWSGGYGGISRLLENAEDDLSSIDAILVLDGIHCGYTDDRHQGLNTRIISPFFEATRQAAQGKLLFTITHSEVDPPYYAGTTQTADVLLDLVEAKARRGQPAAGARALEGRGAGRVEEAREDDGADHRGAGGLVPRAGLSRGTPRSTTRRTSCKWPRR